MTKSEKLAELERQFRAWQNPPLKGNRVNPVFGEGNPEATVMFIGEAPGFNENRLGRPFVGQAGKLLDEMLATIGLDRKEIYITNIVKDQPPDNRDPNPTEIAAYAPYLAKQIEIINPKIIVTLGRISLGNLLPGVGSIGTVHGKVFQKGSRYYISLYHPAAALHQNALKETLFQDFRIIEKVIRKVREEKVT